MSVIPTASAPRVSVVIATYKRPERLIRAVSSALAQTFADIEVVVAIENGDQASLDAVRRIEDPRARYAINPNERGPGPNRDSGIRASRGHFVAFLDDDDEWLPHKLERQLASITDDRTIGITQAYVTTSFGTSLLPTSPYQAGEAVDEWLFDRRHWLKPRGSFAQTSTIIAPRALFDHLQFGRVRHEEWELIIRAVKQHGYKLTTVMEPLVRYQGGGSYAWEESMHWAGTVRDLLSPRALSGFYLTVLSQTIPSGNRLPTARRLLEAAFRNGRPTARQLFAFVLFTLIPRNLRSGLLARLSRRQVPHSSSN